MAKIGKLRLWSKSIWQFNFLNFFCATRRRVGFHLTLKLLVQEPIFFVQNMKINQSQYFYIRKSDTLDFGGHSNWFNFDVKVRSRQECPDHRQVCIKAVWWDAPFLPPPLPSCLIRLIWSALIRISHVL